MENRIENKRITSMVYIIKQIIFMAMYLMILKFTSVIVTCIIKRSTKFNENTKSYVVHNFN